MNLFSAKTLIAALFLPVALGAYPVIYLDDNFNDGDRLNQNLPNSAQWLGAYASLIEVAPGNYALQNAPPSATRQMVAYFAPTDAPVSIAPGESLRVAFEVTPTSKEPRSDTWSGIRMGVFHSGDSRLTDDTNSSVSPVGGGYGLFTNPRTNRTVMRDRNSDSAVLITSMTTGWSSDWPDVSSPAAADRVPMNQNETYQVELLVSRSLTNDLSFHYTISDGVKSVTGIFGLPEGLTPLFSFDTLAIGMHADFGTSYIDNVSVSVIPEPAAFGLFGACAALLVLLRRRKAVGR
jgi:hypothetical protein